MSWASRAAANLLPLSVEQDDLATALREWVYEGGEAAVALPVGAAAAVVRVVVGRGRWLAFRRVHRPLLRIPFKHDAARQLAGSPPTP